MVMKSITCGACMMFVFGVVVNAVSSDKEALRLQKDLKSTNYPTAFPTNPTMSTNKPTDAPTLIPSGMRIHYEYEHEYEYEYDEKEYEYEYEYEENNGGSCDERACGYGTKWNEDEKVCVVDTQIICGEFTKFSFGLCVLDLAAIVTMGNSGEGSLLYCDGDNMVTNTFAPTAKPTNTPSHFPTITPTNAPTNKPSKNPTPAPTAKPSNSPSNAPTKAPSSAPSVAPTNYPTIKPSTSPTPAPTDKPSNAPTVFPTSGAPTSPTLQACTSCGRNKRCCNNMDHCRIVSRKCMDTLAPTPSPSEAPTPEGFTYAPTLSPTDPCVKLSRRACKRTNGLCSWNRKKKCYFHID